MHRNEFETGDFMIHTEKRPLYLLVLALIVIQPLLDVTSYWLNAGGAENTPTLVLRLGLLLITVLLGFTLAEKRRSYYITAGVLLALTLGHVLACIQFGYAKPMRDLTNLVRIYLMPLTVLSFCTLLRRFPDLRKQIPMAFALCLLLILVVELLAAATGTDPHTYPNKSIGLLGWFYYANSQSAILCMLAPVVIVYMLRRFSSPIPFLLTSLVAMGMLFLLATRLAMLGCILTGLALGLCLLLRRNWLQGAWLILLAVVFALLIPLSPMTNNQQKVQDNAQIKQEEIDRTVSQKQVLTRKAGKTNQSSQDSQDSQSSQSSQERPELSLRTAYDTYLPGLVEHFGLTRTAEAYGYSQNAADICDVRRAKLTYSRLLLEDSPASAKLFGMELSRWDTSSGSYDVENDFHGIFFLCGGVGLVLLLCFLGWFVVLAVRGFIRKKFALLTPEFVALLVSLATCTAHIYATSGVLRRPNASFYLAVCLALCWKDCRDALAPASAK